MKYHQLRAFLTVAEQGSIRAAARSLHLSQAALTKALKEIEQDLGVPLVLRTARGVQLTAFGQQLRIRAQLVVSEMRRAEDDIAQMKGAAASSVSAAVTPAAALAILPQAYRAFRREMPNARVSFVEGFPGVALPRLRDGTLDFVVAVIVPEHLGPEFDHIELYESHSVVVAREGHPLRACTSLAELSEAEWLLNSSPESSTRALLDLFGDLGYAVPQRVIECPSFVIAHGLLRGSDMLAAMAGAVARTSVGRRRACRPAYCRSPAGDLCRSGYAARQSAYSCGFVIARLPATGGSGEDVSGAAHGRCSTPCDASALLWNLFSLWSISSAPVRGGTYFLCCCKESKQRKQLFWQQSQRVNALAIPSGAAPKCRPQPSTRLGARTH